MVRHVSWGGTPNPTPRRSFVILGPRAEVSDIPLLNMLIRGGGGGDWCHVKLAVVNLAVGNLAEAPGFRVVNFPENKLTSSCGDGAAAKF